MSTNNNTNSYNLATGVNRPYLQVNGQPLTNTSYRINHGAIRRAKTGDLTVQANQTSHPPVVEPKVVGGVDGIGMSAQLLLTDDSEEPIVPQTTSSDNGLTAIEFSNGFACSVGDVLYIADFGAPYYFRVVKVNTSTNVTINLPFADVPDIDGSFTVGIQKTDIGHQAEENYFGQKMKVTVNDETSHKLEPGANQMEKNINKLHHLRMDNRQDLIRHFHLDIVTNTFNTGVTVSDKLASFGTDRTKQSDGGRGLQGNFAFKHGGPTNNTNSGTYDTKL